MGRITCRPGSVANGLACSLASSGVSRPASCGDSRLAMSKKRGADVTLDCRECDVVGEVLRLGGGGEDVAIEALGTQQTLESCLSCLRPEGTLSSPGSILENLNFHIRGCSRAGRSSHRCDSLPRRKKAYEAASQRSAIGAFRSYHDVDPQILS